MYSSACNYYLNYLNVQYNSILDIFITYLCTIYWHNNIYITFSSFLSAFTSINRIWPL